MVIVVISDAHGLVRPQAMTMLDGSDRIIHAGDVDGPEVLAALAPVVPVTAARGNKRSWRPVEDNLRNRSDRCRWSARLRHPRLQGARPRSSGSGHHRGYTHPWGLPGTMLVKRESMPFEDPVEMVLGKSSDVLATVAAERSDTAPPDAAPRSELPSWSGRGRWCWWWRTRHTCAALSARPSSPRAFSRGPGRKSPGPRAATRPRFVLMELGVGDRLPDRLA
jgi:hypothetical protein